VSVCDEGEPVRSIRTDVTASRFQRSRCQS
jgi:hypothetical protein